MFANLYNYCRSMVAFVMLPCLVWHGASAQNISYSPSELNRIYDVQTYVAGRVSSSIIIWKYLPACGASQMLIYNENMELRKRKNANVFASGDIYQLNFVDRQSSFDVVAQLFSKHKFYCQLASFNEDGELLRPVKTLFCYEISKKYADYRQFAVSENKRYFALIGDKLNTPHTQMELVCSLYYFQDSLQNSLNKTIALPYYNNNNATFSSPHLDNAGNLFVAEYISPDKDSASHLILYKSYSGSNDFSGTVLDLVNIHLKNINIKVNNHNQQCIVYALGYQAIALPGYKTPSTDEGIFSWAVSEIVQKGSFNTAYTFSKVDDGGGGPLQDLLAKNLIPLTDNSYAIALNGCAQTKQKVYDDDEDNYTYFNDGSYSPGFFEAENPQVYLPGGGDGKGLVDNHRAAVNGNPATTGNTGDNLYIMRIRSDDHKIMWSQHINSNQEDAFVYVNKYSLLNSGGTLNFICKKLLPKNKKSFEEITVNPDGEVNIKPIMEYNRDYDILIDQGVQIGSNSMVFPCVYNGTTLAFAKLDLD